MSQPINDFVIIPYCHFDESCLFSDEFIMTIYDQMVDENLLDKVFIEGQMANRNKFLAMMKQKGRYLFMAFSGYVLLAIGWIDEIIDKRGFIHFCGFRAVRSLGPGKSIEIGRGILSMVLNNLGLNVLIGLTNASNKLAVRYVKKIGGTILGILPKSMWNEQMQVSEDAVLTYYTKEVFYENL